MDNDDERAEYNGILYKKVNGWTNYPTWAAKLWIDNEETTAADIRDIVANGADDNATADAVRDYFQDGALGILEDAHVMASMMSDILTWAYSQVNWLEIVEAIQDEIKEG